MLIVADSSALIALATCDGLDVLLHVYDDIKVPEAVFVEIVAQRNHNPMHLDRSYLDVS